MESLTPYKMGTRESGELFPTNKEETSSRYWISKTNERKATRLLTVDFFVACILSISDVAISAMAEEKIPFLYYYLFVSVFSLRVGWLILRLWWPNVFTWTNTKKKLAYTKQSIYEHDVWFCLILIKCIGIEYPTSKI